MCLQAALFQPDPSQQLARQAAVNLGRPSKFGRAALVAVPLMTKCEIFGLLASRRQLAGDTQALRYGPPRCSHATKFRVLRTWLS